MHFSTALISFLALALSSTTAHGAVVDERPHSVHAPFTRATNAAVYESIKSAEEAFAHSHAHPVPTAHIEARENALDVLLQALNPNRVAKPYGGAGIAAPRVTQAPAAGSSSGNKGGRTTVVVDCKQIMGPMFVGPKWCTEVFST